MLKGTRDHAEPGVVPRHRRRCGRLRGAHLLAHLARARSSPACCLQLAYVIDCVDGQLARIKSMASPVGRAARLHARRGQGVHGHRRRRRRGSTCDPAVDARWLLIGLGGLFVAATGITLTTLHAPARVSRARPARRRCRRRPSAATHAPKSLSPLALVEALGRYVLHYPSWFLFVCAFNRLDIFLYAYLGAHLLYLGRASLIDPGEARPPRRRRMKAIIVAAGMGRRLAPYTDDRPKCWSRSTGARSCSARSTPIAPPASTRSYIVRGYMKEKIVVDGRALLRQRRLPQQQHPDVAVLRRAGDGRAAFSSATPTSCSGPRWCARSLETEGDYALVHRSALARGLRRAA